MRGGRSRSGGTKRSTLSSRRQHVVSICRRHAFACRRLASNTLVGWVRYTHRVAISNRRLIAADEAGVTFKWKDYRIEGPDRYKTMTLPTGEFIRRFLTHVLPKGLHRIRHYGLFANGHRAANVARARELLAVPSRAKQPETSATAAADEPRVLPRPCRCCGGRMIIIETFARGCQPKHRPASATGAIEIDTS